MSAIARQLERRSGTWLKQAVWVPYRREATVETMLSPRLAWLTEQVPQVRYSARILYQELVVQRDTLAATTR